MLRVAIAGFSQRAQDGDCEFEVVQGRCGLRIADCVVCHRPSRCE